MVLSAIVYHVCEKTSDIHIPDVNQVYQQINAVNDGNYTVFLLPELNGHADWAAELSWIQTNFSDIPIMLDIAGGWAHHLTTDDILAAMAVANVQWLRIAELASWYLDQVDPFPDSYVLGILAFCRAHNLKLFWAEWKIDFGQDVKTFNKIKELIVGYEDIVTVGFKTNSGDLEPAEGFQYVINKGFTHIGCCVESWYWETRHRTSVWEPREGLESPDNMPIAWMVRHAMEAKALGLELIQFEPYWYFFEEMTGKALESLQRIHLFLNSLNATMDNSLNILQTILAEWVSNPTKDEIEWVESNAPTIAGYDIQPSAFDFNKSIKMFEVRCRNLGVNSQSSNFWIRDEIVAVDILVKTIGTTLDKASIARQCMKSEVERILGMYSKIAPLWDPTPGPTGAYHHRRIPGLAAVSINQFVNQVDSSSLSQVTIQVKCRPAKSLVL
jgi:hypothetical protein